MEYYHEGSDPPFEQTYKHLFLKQSITPTTTINATAIMEEHDLPTVDLRRLAGASEEERESCKREIVEASKEWGFFQVVNHGISHHILEKMNKEQVKLFREPFNKKQRGDTCHNLRLSPGSYRWGTPTATCLRQLAWSEVFHIPLTNVFASDDVANNDLATYNYYYDNNNYSDNHHPQVSCLSLTVKEFAASISKLAHKLAKILAENLGNNESIFFEEKCVPKTCYLRMNRYPPCPKYYSQVFGLVPHTDSDFLTILHQDHVGGLQLVKDGKWIAVKPNSQALIVNIGDLFQAWSNGLYKSVEHRVVASPKAERFSTAYFLCPSHDAVIESSEVPPLYKKFNFREYRQQVQDDVRELGYKIGLARFLVCN